MLLVLIICAYLIGSISVAALTCKILKLPDPKTQGSKNPGATNVLRIGGKKAATITLIGDGLKGAISILIGRYLGLDLLEMTGLGLAAFLGHVYPVFFGFKGGKGVATFLGSLLALNYLVGIGFICIWLLIAKILKISSLSALGATLATPALFYLITDNLKATGVIAVICLWIFYTHKPNIKLMLLGSENKIKP